MYFCTASWGGKGWNESFFFLARAVNHLCDPFAFALPCFLHLGTKRGGLDSDLFYEDQNILLYWGELASVVDCFGSGGMDKKSPAVVRATFDTMTLLAVSSLLNLSFRVVASSPMIKSFFWYGPVPMLSTWAYLYACSFYNDMTGTLNTNISFQIKE